MTDAPRYKFTMRQRQVMQGVKDNLSYGEIAVLYGIGYETVVTYAKQIRERVGLEHLPPKSAIKQHIKTSPDWG